MPVKNKEMPAYLKRVWKASLEKEKPEAKPARKAVKHAKRNKGLTLKKNLRETWDEVTEGPFGTVIYVILGFLIALAVNESLKPILLTDMPVVAVFSESMVPTFDKGDMIIVQGGTPIKEGDIVVYDAPIYKYPIIHRVINISESGVATKGDHNAAADPWMTPLSKVHGKAILRIPYLGWVKVGTYELLGFV